MNFDHLTGNDRLQAQLDYIEHVMNKRRATRILQTCFMVGAVAGAVATAIHLTNDKEDPK